MKSKITKRLVSIILVLMLIFATQSTAFAWGHSKWVTKTMYTSNKVLGMASKDEITYFINEKGGIEKVSVQQKGIHFLGLITFEPNGYKIIYGTNKVRTYWSAVLSISYLGAFS